MTGRDIGSTTSRLRVRAVDERVARLASRQHGAFSRTQAMGEGCSQDMVTTRLGSRRWLPTGLRGVYRIAGHPVTWQHRVMAACLSCPGAVASHLTAAALFGLVAPPDEPHVTAPPTASARRRGVVVHRSPLVAADRCAVQRIPATVPARTLVDCAQLLDAPALMAIVDSALCRRLTTPMALQRAARSVSPDGARRGLALLREVLGVWTDGIQPGSAAEMRLLRRIDRWGLPRPDKQVELLDAAGRFVARLDLGWPDQRAGLEYDGRDHHGPRQWEADEVRQARIEALGWRVERVENVDLLDGAERLRGVLVRLLGLAA